VEKCALQFFWSGELSTPIYLEWTPFHSNIFGVDTFPLQNSSLPWSKQSYMMMSRFERVPWNNYPRIQHRSQKLALQQGLSLGCIAPLYVQTQRLCCLWIPRICFTHLLSFAAHMTLRLNDFMTTIQVLGYSLCSLYVSFSKPLGRLFLPFFKS
jgi:hypothetical protein